MNHHKLARKAPRSLPTFEWKTTHSDVETWVIVSELGDTNKASFVFINAKSALRLVLKCVEIFQEIFSDNKEGTVKPQIYQHF